MADAVYLFFMPYEYGALSLLFPEIRVLIVQCGSFVNNLVSIEHVGFAARIKTFYINIVGSTVDRVIMPAKWEQVIAAQFFSFR